MGWILNPEKKLITDPGYKKHQIQDPVCGLATLAIFPLCFMFQLSVSDLSLH
jgi:hypothetical protein